MMDPSDRIQLGAPREERVADGAVLLRGHLGERDQQLLAEVHQIAEAAPFRKMVTPGGFTMSVAMTSCGSCGWVTDRKGYRYDRLDPASGRPWPAMPGLFTEIAQSAAACAGFAAFAPDACLVNRYEPGAKMSLHQDKDERDLTQPVVSVSLGLPAVFLLGGATRAEKPGRVTLEHGDVLVFGGPSRLRYHGVSPLREGEHRHVGRARINLTFRKAK